MSSTIIYVVLAGLMAYHFDEIGLKKYEMIDENENIIKVQFSKKSNYSCPLSCDLGHYHYAKNVEAENEYSDKEWIIKYDKNKNGTINYDINGQSINSYKVIKNIKTPKSSPKINMVDINE